MKIHSLPCIRLSSTSNKEAEDNVINHRSPGLQARLHLGELSGPLYFSTSQRQRPVRDAKMPSELGGKTHRLTSSNLPKSNP